MSDEGYRNLPHPSAALGRRVVSGNEAPSSPTVPRTKVLPSMMQNVTDARAIIAMGFARLMRAEVLGGMRPHDVKALTAFIDGLTKLKKLESELEAEGQITDLTRDQMIEQARKTLELLETEDDSEDTNT